MIKSALILLVSNLLCFSFTSAQSKVYLGFERGPKWDINHRSDGGTHLYTNVDESETRPMFTGYSMWGINASYLYKEKLYIESGLYKNYFADGFVLVDDAGGTGFGTDRAFYGWQIPLRFKVPLNLIKEKLFITPFMGIAFLSLPKPGFYDSESTNGFIVVGSVDSVPTDSVNYSYDAFILRKTNFLLEAGLSVEIKLLKTAFITLSGSYFKGFNKLNELRITYNVNDSGEQKGTTYTKGDMFYVSLGLKYQISALWDKKAEE